MMGKTTFSLTIELLDVIVTECLEARGALERGDDEELLSHALEIEIQGTAISQFVARQIDPNRTGVALILCQHDEDPVH